MSHEQGIIWEFEMPSCKMHMVHGKRACEINKIGERESRGRAEVQ